MKKEFTNEEILSMCVFYSNNKLSTRAIGKLFGISDPTVSKILKENNVILRSSGRQDIGGKKEANKRYIENNKTKLSEYHKEWRKGKNNDRNTYHSQWREDNRDKVNAYKRVYEKNKKDNDPAYKFATYTRTAIWETLKTKRGTGIFKNMDYTVKELISHIEKLFTTGMTWDNYGDWHLDHKIPLSHFTFSDFQDPEFKQCWALSNLQPLWSTTREINGIIHIGNLNKNNRI